MEKLAKIGFDGIELYGMHGFTSDDIRKFCRDTGLTILCDHIRYREFSRNTQRVVESRKAIGTLYLTIDEIPFECLTDDGGFRETIAEIERIAKVCRVSGIQLLYHNHGHDLTRSVSGAPVLDLILDNTDPKLLKFQPDLGWLALGGGNPLEYLQRHNRRCPVIHLKDYYADKPVLMESAFVLGNKRGGPEHNHFEFRPSGYGIMNYPALMPAVLECQPDWITVDHDLSYERDTFQDMEMSLRYIKQLINLYSH
jgi:sugar phosphate isomerase/epimerase